MKWYRFFKSSDDGTTVTIDPSVKKIVRGNSTTGVTVTGTSSADAYGDLTYFTSASTGGTSYGRYNKLTGTGAGAEFIANRDRVSLSAAAGNAHGNHTSLSVSSTGYVTGLGTAGRFNITPSDTVVPYGTYYALMAEIYAGGNTSALPTSNACLGINAQPGTAMDAVVNAIAFGGTDGTGCMIDASSVTPTYVGSIRILVNGAVRYLYYGSNAT